MITDQFSTNQGNTNRAIAIGQTKIETQKLLFQQKELKKKIQNNMDSGRDLIDESSAPNTSGPTVASMEASA